MTNSRTRILIALVMTGALPAMATAAPLSGEWSGTYTCAQGETAADITLAFAGNQWHGVFEFGPLKTNKAVPFGSYDMSITQEGDDIVFAAGDWIVQPDDYVTVDLRGRLSDDLMRISGEVEFESCTTFELVRTTPLPQKTK